MNLLRIFLWFKKAREQITQGTQSKEPHPHTFHNGVSKAFDGTPYGFSESSCSACPGSGGSRHAGPLSQRRRWNHLTCPKATLAVRMEPLRVSGPVLAFCPPGTWAAIANLEAVTHLGPYCLTFPGDVRLTCPAMTGT